MEQAFHTEKTLIGQGKMAKVYLWNGFAYKCFNSDYPNDWIDYEIRIQNTISKTGLPTVNYYDSEIPHSIKMDFIDGTTLGERIRKEKYKGGLEDLLLLFSQIHKIKDIDFPSLNPFLTREINKLNIDDSMKQLAAGYICDIKDEKTLCHLDYHFLNLMYSHDRYYIIDWINSKIGNPIYDYARTYVILYEFANRFSKKYLNTIKEQNKFNQSDFKKAIYVMALHRLSEYDSEKVKKLISEISI